MSLRDIKHLEQTEGFRIKNQTQKLDPKKHVLSLNTKSPCLLGLSIWGINIYLSRFYTQFYCHIPNLLIKHIILKSEAGGKDVFLFSSEYIFALLNCIPFSGVPSLKIHVAKLIQVTKVPIER